MICSLYLCNFRNFKQAEITFKEGLNVIYGDNAQGKTNLLEAISLLSLGRSFRSQHLTELVRYGESSFYLEARILQNQVSQTVKLSFDGKQKKLQINANTYHSFNPLLGTLPLVLYSPNDAELISGAPSYRRRFLNLHLAQSDPLYVQHYCRFWRAMKQRNCLLRMKGGDPIECWEIEMAKSASYLQQSRRALLEELASPLSLYSNTISQQEIHELRYHPSGSGNYLQQLQNHRKRDQELGITTIGPHRDDLSFWIGNQLAKTYASEGQKKTAVAALRLAEWDRLAQRLSSFPLMAIDDFGVALDEIRQNALRRSLQKLGQVFLTTPIQLSGASHYISIAEIRGGDRSMPSPQKTG